MTIPVTGCSRIWAPQPAWAPAWNRSRSWKPSRVNIADEAGEEPPGAAERVMVVVGPAQAEPVLPGLLHPGGRVARLPVLALGLEDQVAGQVGRARQLDDPLQGRLGGVESLGVVVEPPPAASPEVAAPPGRRGPRAASSGPRGPGRRGTARSPGSPGARRRPASSARPGSGRSGRAPSDSPAISRPRSWARENAGDRLDLDRDLAHAERRARRRARAADRRPRSAERSRRDGRRPARRPRRSIGWRS